MSQVQITGKYVNVAQVETTGTFTKQRIIVEVTNGTFVSNFPVEFHQQDVQNLMPQLQPNGTYVFTCYIQGSKQNTDKNGQPTAYLSLKCTSFVPAAQQQPMNNPPAPVQDFNNGGNNFQNNNGGYVGNPPAQQNNFPNNNGGNNNFPAQQNNGFPNNPPAPAQQNNGFPAQNNSNPGFNNGFPNANANPPAQTNDPFNQNGGGATGQFNNF